MTAISLTVNGSPTNVVVEPRTHLADVLREQLFLTGTHLGCEQGVCGACTVLIDGRPMRSCIAFAVTCDGADIRTIEGFGDDALMNEMREAFSAHHALQCGFCTSGMLITSRDIVQRLGETDERTIREELSGNLCRCTGYVGIVRAVQAVALGKTPSAPAAVVRESAGVPEIAQSDPVAAPPPKRATSKPQADAVPSASRAPVGAVGWTGLTQTVHVKAPPDAVWKAVKDVRAMAACLPGAAIETFDGANFKGVLAIKFGPIRANFGGEGIVAYEDGTSSGLVEGGGSDKRTGSQVRGQVEFMVRPHEASGSAIDVTIRYRITGALAQFARGAIVQSFVGHLTGIFAGNLGRLANSESPASVLQGSNELNALGVMFTFAKNWFERLFRRKGA